MFKAGAFSSDPAAPHQVNRGGLKKVTLKSLERGLQASEDNPMAGLEGRAGLLMRLSDAMDNTEFFGIEGRPGNMIGKISADGGPPQHIADLSQIIYCRIPQPKPHLFQLSLCQLYGRC